MQPLSKHEERVAKDRLAAGLYKRRIDIEKLRERRELERNTREVWDV
ncbi:MAG: hypothetical protein U9Q35_01125 [Pseudomonadota bacterium]|nr:hypothetical protein [Pseudomonadota bacterium]